MTRPFREIILAEEEYAEATKERTVTIHKQELVTDINALTYKFSNRVMQGAVQQDLVAADTKDNLDGTILNRFMDYRDARIRKRMKFAMAVEDVDMANDTMRPADDYIYHFVLNGLFPDSTLKAVAGLIHRYIVWGALYDWYLNLGLMQQAQYYKAEADELEKEVVRSLRVPSRCRRPLQPFGPAKKGGSSI